MRTSDFQRALASRPCARTEHFALHYVVAPQAVATADLSTARGSDVLLAVDGSRRLGLVVPKRLARRAVTRNLVKRQSRQAFMSASQQLCLGDWLVRLRRSFDPAHFVSASSDSLRSAVGAELQALFTSASAAIATDRKA